MKHVNTQISGMATKTTQEASRLYVAQEGRRWTGLGWRFYLIRFSAHARTTTDAHHKPDVRRHRVERRKRRRRRSNCAARVVSRGGNG